MAREVGVAEGPEWEDRVTQKFDWIRTIEGLPPNSLLFAHERCSGRCTKSDGEGGQVARLRPSVIAHVGLTIAHRAEVDGRNAWIGTTLLAEATKRHRRTVLTAVGHLVTVGLLAIWVRASAPGVPRAWATVYCLITPPANVMARAGLNEKQTAMWEALANIGGPLGED